VQPPPGQPPAGNFAPGPPPAMPQGAMQPVAPSAIAPPTGSQ